MERAANCVCDQSRSSGCSQPYQFLDGAGVARHDVGGGAGEVHNVVDFGHQLRHAEPAPIEGEGKRIFPPRALPPQRRLLLGPAQASVAHVDPIRLVVERLHARACGPGCWGNSVLLEGAHSRGHPGLNRAPHLTDQPGEVLVDERRHNVLEACHVGDDHLAGPILLEELNERGQREGVRGEGVGLVGVGSHVDGYGLTRFQPVESAQRFEGVNEFLLEHGYFGLRRCKVGEEDHADGLVSVLAVDELEGACGAGQGGKQCRTAGQFEELSAVHVVWLARIAHWDPPGSSQPIHRHCAKQKAN